MNQFIRTLQTRLIQLSLLFFLLSVSNSLFGQLNYTFSSQTVGTYTPITGGTSFLMVDDALYTATIPSFTFNGTPYTSITISTNGFIVFGNVGYTTTTYAAISTTATAAGVVAPFARDLTTATGTPEIRVETVGSEVVIQWQDVRRFISGERISFQVRLNTSTNDIQIVYGGTITPMNNTTYPQVGLRGANNTQYNNRSVLSTTGAWVNSTAGTANNNTCYFNSTNPGTVPAVGTTFTWSALVPCATANGGTIPLAQSRCDGQTASMSATGADFGLGISYQWEVSSTGGGVGFADVVGGTGATTTSYTSAALSTGTYYYRLRVTCATGPVVGYSNEQEVTVNSLPVVAVSPLSGNYCSPGGAAVSLTASGADSYAWSPAAGLSATTGANVDATPASTTTYTVTGTVTATGCTNTATSSITVSNAPIISATTADPSFICNGANSQLNVSAFVPTTDYLVQSVTYDFEVPSGTRTTIFSSGDDANSPSITLPFVFNYMGTDYSTMAAYTNGFIQLGTASGNTGSYGATIPTAATPNNIIAGVWDDLNVTGVGALVSHFTNGAAPNRVFIVEYSAVKFYNSSSNDGDVTFQIKLYEGTNVVEVHLNNVVDPSPSNHYTGIENATGAIGYGATGRNPFNTDITTSEAWQFMPNGAITYAWTPTTFLSDPAIANPMATAVTATTSYTVEASANGCTSMGSVSLTVSSGTATVSPSVSSPLCEGGVITVTANAVGATPISYVWTNSGSGESFSGDNTLGAKSYTVDIVDNCGAMASGTVNYTVNALPTVTVTPSSATYCTPGAAVSLTASGADTYDWSPAAGLSTTTGANVDATPSAATTYTVTGTNTTTGCVNTNTVAIATANGPSISSTNATPPTICSGGDSQLETMATVAYNQTVNGYSFAQSNAAYTPLAGGTNSTATGDDGTQAAIPIGFTFNYGGTDYTTFSISTNGTIRMGGSPSSYINDLDGVVNVLAPFWDDNHRTTGAISYLVSGTTPNQVLTIDWFNVAVGGSGSTSNPTNQYQIRIYETTNVIEFHYGSLTAANGISASIGLSGVVGNFMSVTPAATATVSTTVENANIIAVTDIPAGTLYTFTPPLAPTMTYAWSPATFLSDPAIANPMANSVTATTSYMVEVSANGCTSTDNVLVTVNPGSIMPAPTNGTTYVADYEALDGTWTHYYDDAGTPANPCDDYLLLSIEKNGNNIGVVGDLGFSVEVTGGAGASLVAPNSNYVTSSSWYTMNRNWALTPTAQPTSDVNVRFYFTDADYQAVQTAVNTAGGTVTAPTDLTFYKINGSYNSDPAAGHVGIPAAATYDANGYWQYANGASASSTDWAYSAFGTDHMAEYTVASFSGGGGGSSPDNGAFPVEWLSFNASPNGKKVDLQWVVGQEQGNDFFTVMRSEDMQNWEDLARVNSVGNHTQALTYRAVDAAPVQGRSYYQIRQTDFDGNQSTSRIQTVFMDASNGLVVYPNPNNGNFTLSVSGKELSGTLTLVDVSGRVVYTDTLSDFVGDKAISVKDIAKGMYLLHLTETGGKDTVVKIVVE